MCRTLLATLFPGLTFFLALGLAACSGGEERKNLLIVSVDTLRADALGFAGYEAAQTPNLDRLAAEGTVFTRAIAPIPRTTPALGSLLTGRWPQHHGSREVGDPIVDGVTTLAEVLSRRGYVTLAVSANNAAGPKQELDRGFDRFITYDDLIEIYGDDLYRDLTPIPPDRKGWATAVTDQALALLGAAPRDEPYFLWLFYFDPHFLYRPPEPWQSGVEAEGCWRLYRYFGEHRKESGQVFADVGGVASEALEDCRRLYDVEITYADAEIGRLIETLRASGRLEDTVIHFVADHGENFGEAGLFFEHGDNVHGAGLQVPFVWSGPGIARGRRDEGVVSLVDTLPTILELLGVPGDERPPVDGIDLSPRLDPSEPQKRPDERRVVFAESATAMWNEAVGRLTTGRTWWRVCINDQRFALCEIPGEAPGEYLLYDHAEDPELSLDVAAEHPEAVERLLEAWRHWPPETARERTARTRRFKLVERPRLDGGYDAELYDLENDPAEAVDVKEEFPKVYGFLSRELADWTATVPGETEERPHDPELEETLRTLGYIE